MTYEELKKAYEAAMQKCSELESQNAELESEKTKLEKKIEKKNSNIFAELLQEEENGKETNIINADYVENSIS